MNIMQSLQRGDDGRGRKKRLRQQRDGARDFQRCIISRCLISSSWERAINTIFGRATHAWLLPAAGHKVQRRGRLRVGVLQTARSTSALSLHSTWASDRARSPIPIPWFVRLPVPPSVALGLALVCATCDRGRQQSGLGARASWRGVVGPPRRRRHHRASLHVTSVVM